MRSRKIAWEVCVSPSLAIRNGEADHPTASVMDEHTAVVCLAARSRRGYDISRSDERLASICLLTKNVSRPKLSSRCCSVSVSIWSAGNPTGLPEQ